MSGRGRARWGWYRLADQFAGALVDSSGIGHGDLVLDLGAGDGAITRRLVDTGARVLAVELHPERASRLDARFAAVEQVTVVRVDLVELRLPRQPFRVVANPPFGLVSPVLNRLTARGSALAGASLVVPVSVAVRWRRLLDVRRTPWTLTIESRIPRSAFTPQPRIDCCIAQIALDHRRRSPRRP